MSTGRTYVFKKCLHHNNRVQSDARWWLRIAMNDVSRLLLDYADSVPLSVVVLLFLPRCYTVIRLFLLNITCAIFHWAISLLLSLFLSISVQLPPRVHLNCTDIGKQKHLPNLVSASLLWENKPVDFSQRELCNISKK